MKSSQSKPTPAISANNVDSFVKHLITLIDELVAVIEEENKVLARGIPASLTSSIKRKNELADAFERTVKQVTDHQLCSRISDKALHHHLIARCKELRVVMTENTDRLRAAIEATRRRIEAVMRAISSEMTGKSSYGPNGRQQGPRGVQSMRGNGISA